MGANNNDLSEEWISYRKLVIETLSKLDDRSLELYDRVADLAARVHVLESAKNSSRDIDLINESLDDLDGDLKSVTSRITVIETELTKKTTISAVFSWIGKSMWALLAVAIGAASSYFAGR